MSASKNIVWSPLDYEQGAVIAHAAGEEMLARLEWMTIKPQAVLDVGCGTGVWSRRLCERYPQATIFAVDSSAAMIEHAKQQTHTAIAYFCTDAATLPLADQSIDLIFANFLLPWHTNVKALLREWRRVLRPDGLLMLTALGPDTLQEWREVLSADLIPSLVDMHDVGDGLLQEGFAEPVLDVDHYTLTYRGGEKWMRELCASGMLAEPAAMTVWQAESECDWQTTYEIIYAHAFVPADSDERGADSDGVVRVPLAHLRQRLRGK